MLAPPKKAEVERIRMHTGESVPESGSLLNCDSQQTESKLINANQPSLNINFSNIQELNVKYIFPLRGDIWPFKLISRSIFILILQNACNYWIESIHYINYNNKTLQHVYQSNEIQNPSLHCRSDTETASEVAFSLYLIKLFNAVQSWHECIYINKKKTRIHTVTEH